MINLIDFIYESNRIEGINEVTESDLAAHETFLNLSRIGVEDLERFVAQVQPGAQLRDKIGMDVRVGRHIAPRGGKAIRERLEDMILYELDDPWRVHTRYLTLHPFMDGNGRSARALWLWQVKTPRYGFLQSFYYQTLAEVDRR